MSEHTSDGEDDEQIVLDDAHLSAMIAARRCVLETLQDRDLTFEPAASGVSLEALCIALASLAAGQMVAHAREQRRLSPEDALAESIAMSEEMLTGYELARLNEGRMPPPAPLPEDG